MSKHYTFKLTIALLSLLPTVTLSLPSHSAPKVTPRSPQVLAQLYNSLSDSESRELEQASEQLVNHLAEGEYEAALEQLQPSVREAFTAETLQQQWEAYLEEAGTFVRIVNLRPTPTLDGYIVLVTAAFDKGTDDLIVQFNEERQIIGLDSIDRNVDIQEVAEKFVDDLVAGEYGVARAYFHPTLKAEIFPEDLEERWQALQQTTGEFQQRLDSEVIAGSDVDIVKVNIEFENVTDSLIVIFQNNRIAGVDFPRGRVEQ